jgi:hypothetical protein
MLLQKYARVQGALLRRVCKLTDDQEQQLSKMVTADWISNEVKQATDAPAKWAAAGIARLLGGRAVVANGQNQPQEINVLVRKVIDKKIASLLNEQQASQFHEECEARDHFRREAQAGMLVAVLDRRLYLTEPQREALLPLIAKWLQKDLYWQFYFQNEAYIPNIPKTILSQVLEREQVDALAGLNSYNYEAEQIEMQLGDQQDQFIIQK